MNVNTYNATPVLDQVVSFPSKGRRFRVFNDGGDLWPLWFEVGPDQFFCGENYADAVATQQEVPKSGVSLDALRNAYPEGFVTNA